MLWLAGLMGLMAVGTAAYIDPQSTEPTDDDEGIAPEPDLTGDTLSDSDIVADITLYDPRGGDDAADLGPLLLSPDQMIFGADGTDADDALGGTDGNDDIAAGSGDDHVSGAAGNDALFGQEGNDTLLGDGGADTLNGEDGDDILSGGAEDDVLTGHNADDMLFGDGGDDSLMGSSGEDTLNGGSGDDVMHGGLDDDTLIGGTGSDTLFGGWGNDMLSGVMRGIDLGGTGTADGDQSDFLNGGDGDDSILAGAGDIVTAGTGADQIALGDWITGGNAAEVIDFAPEEDSLLLVWDDTDLDAEAPRIDVTADPEAAGRSIVLMNGSVIASINGVDLAPEDMSLVPLSAATAMGFAPGL